MGKVRLVVEAKNAGDARTVGPALSQLASYAGRGGDIPVLLVPFMGEVGKRLCAERDVSWFDLSGNAHIVVPGVRIVINGQPNLFRRRGRPSNPFAPRSARVARHLLISAGRAFTQTELVRETGLDDGFTSRIVRRLEQDELIERGIEGRIRVRDRGALLDALAEAYQFDRHWIIRGHVNARSGDELLRRVTSVFPRTLEYAATGLAGAWLHTHFAGFRLVTVFATAQPGESALRELGFRDEPRGANLWLAVPNDRDVFIGKSEIDGIAAVHPVQVYLDLQAQPERSKEAAAELRGRIVKGDS